MSERKTHRYLAVIIYWLCCVVTGAVSGYWFSKCPRDPQPKSMALAAADFALAWPALIGFALEAPRPPYACEVSP